MSCYAVRFITDRFIINKFTGFNGENVFSCNRRIGKQGKYFQLNEMNNLEILLDTLGTKPCQSVGAYSPVFIMEE